MYQVQGPWPAVTQDACRSVTFGDESVFAYVCPAAVQITRTSLSQEWLWQTVAQARVPPRYANWKKAIGGSFSIGCRRDCWASGLRSRWPLSISAIRLSRSGF